MAKPSYVANYIPALIRKGHTATSALQELRANGMSIADKTFYRLWGETVDYLARKENASQVPLNRRPTADVIGQATRPHARGYLHEVEVAVQDPHTGEVAFHAWGVRTQKLINVGSILQMAVDSWAQSQEGGRGTPEGRALGAMYLGTLHLVGEDE